MIFMIIVHLCVIEYQLCTVDVCARANVCVGFSLVAADS